MLRTGSVRFYLFLVSALMAVPPFAAQTAKQTVPPAPIPSQILTGNKVFISNAGVTARYLSSYVVDHTGSVNGLYDEFYAAMKNWGRYELVSSPAEADLVFEISLSQEGPNPQLDPLVGLKILDLKTHTVLWAFVEPVPAGSGREATRRRAWEQALAKLVNDVRQLTGQPPAPAVAPNK